MESTTYRAESADKTILRLIIIIQTLNRPGEFKLGNNDGRPCIRPLAFLLFLRNIGIPGTGNT